MESNGIVSEFICNIEYQHRNCLLLYLRFGREELYVVVCAMEEVSGYIYTCMSRHVRVLYDDIMT